VELEADAIITATGYKRNFGIFEERFRNILEGELSASNLYFFRDMLHP